MAFLKIEKDNAMDRADSAEASLREADSKVQKVFWSLLIVTVILVLIVKIFVLINDVSPS